MCTKLFARPPILPQIAKNVFKGLGSRRILGESWVGRYLLPAAFSAENKKIEFLMDPGGDTGHLQDLHELLLLPESVLQLPDPLVLLVLHAAPVQVVHALTPVTGGGWSHQAGLYHLERLPPLIFLNLDGEPAREEGRESVSLP